MNTELKAVMLLKSLIFHYHGLDDDEAKILNDSAVKLKAKEELKWANEFIAQDYLSAFERSREFLGKIIGALPKEKKLRYLHGVWLDNNKKGYLTEMEPTAMLNLARDWNIHKDLMSLVQD
jgi:hypothetical protein